MKATQTPLHRRTSLGRYCLLVLTNPVQRHWKTPSNIYETIPLSFALKATQTPLPSAHLHWSHLCLCAHESSPKTLETSQLNLRNDTSFCRPEGNTNTTPSAHLPWSQLSPCAHASIPKTLKPPSNINEATPLSFALKATQTPRYQRTSLDRI